MSRNASKINIDPKDFPALIDCFCDEIRKEVRSQLSETRRQYLGDFQRVSHCCPIIRDQTDRCCLVAEQGPMLARLDSIARIIRDQMRVDWRLVALTEIAELRADLLEGKVRHHVTE